MKITKRFCVECNLLVKVRIHKKMYECSTCFSEICRVGDGDKIHNIRKLKVGLDNSTRRQVLDQTDFGNLNEVELARFYPEILSGDHQFWKSQPEDKRILLLQKSISSLTSKQLRILELLVKGKTYREVADICGKSLGLISQTVKAIRKKVKKIYVQNDNEGI